MEKAKFVDELTVKDPETFGDVEIAIYKHPCGGMFGIDCSFIDQCFDDNPTILDPFVDVVDKDNLKYIMLCD